MFSREQIRGSSDDGGAVGEYAVLETAYAP